MKKPGPVPIAIAVRLLWLWGCGWPLGAAVAGDWAVAGAEWRRKLQVEAFREPEKTVSTVVGVPGGVGEPAPALQLCDAAGRSRPLTVLERRGGQWRVLFNSQQPGETLYLYLGGPAEGPAAVPVSGLLQRVRPYDGRAIASLAEFQAQWEAAGGDQGALFVSQVFASFNPCGPNPASLHRYEGSLRVPRAGEYAFCTASTDASFLLLGGREVVAWPGRHAAEAGLDGSQRGTVTLTAGSHRFAYCHANGGGRLYAIAAWVPPGETQHVVIPAENFPDAVFARVGLLEARTGPSPPDFAWDNVWQVAGAGRSLCQYRFAVAGKSAEATPGQYRWDLGDGCQAQGSTVTHCYARPGGRTVTLEWQRPGAAPLRHTQQLWVEEARGRDENDERQSLALLRQALAQEAAGGLEPEGYAPLAAALDFFGQEQALLEFAPRCLARADGLPAGDVFALFYPLALQLQLMGERYELAEQAFAVLRRRLPSGPERARATLHGAGMLVLCRNRAAEGREWLQGVEPKLLSDPQERRLREIYLADCALVLDGVAEASRQYGAIAATVPLLEQGRLNRAYLAQLNSRYYHIQNILAQELWRQALEELDNLEWENPRERLNPYLNLLKARALAGNRQPHKACVCLERALLANVDDHYRPQLRLELARLLLAVGEPLRARTQVKLLRQESPWSKEEVEAEKLQRQIETRLEGGPRR